VVFAHGSDVWLYEVSNEQIRRVTRDAGERIDEAPRMGPAGRITFLRDGAVVGATPGGAARLVVPATGVLAFAWSPDRRTLAYLTQTQAGSHAVYVSRSGTTSLLRMLGPLRKSQGDGQSLTVDDEMSLHWSPGGRALLVVDTLLPSRVGAIHVLARNGHSLTPSVSGTHGGWRDANRLYFRSLAASAWWLLDVRSGERTRLGIRTGRMHPALSPDGRVLALDSGRAWTPGTRRAGCSCTISLYAFATGRERVLTRGGVAPLWLSDRRVATTAVRACSAAECGVDRPMWIARGRSVAMDVTTGRGERLALPSTLDAAFGR
jgi:WD40-like Beta Propeller Repeat